ncbi:hypothetical protein GCM10007216_01920 [Thalassobacillus devorans]|uniref:Uncharacterized protein n=1 Tax=Thalassobacillus devorans TaxID=279813 RepID=A0ABQ1NES0_9BACI|nr:hypothetical protein [Thalassobacillus devorans]NIK27100.1 hypothetical protein [Thalassobacillus devorans]GGC74929.1 hypothetical protein GCM10007216_01920 [Thalassobacillus devorans]
MGYTLPVSMYQYDDYQERTVKPKASPFQYANVHKVTLDNRHLQMRDMARTNKKIPNKNKKLHAPDDMHAAYSEKVYAELTGKGRHFSETI